MSLASNQVCDLPFFYNLSPFSTGPAIAAHLGNVFFVQSSNTAALDNFANGNTAGMPFKTLNFALQRVVPNNQDVIYVLPGHVETVNSATSLAITAGISDGVTIVFVGNAVDRGVINFVTSTAAQVVISANNVTIIGMRVTNAIDALVAAFSITGSDCTLINTQFLDGTSIFATVQLLTSNAAKRLTIQGWTYYETSGGTQKTEAIRIVGGDHHRLENLNIQGSFSTAVVNNVTTATTALLAKGWYLNNTYTSATAVGQNVAWISTSTMLNGDASTVGTDSLFEATVTKGPVQLPQTGNMTLFNIVGGPIHVIQITGYITTVIGSVATATKLTWVPTTGGSNTDLCTTTDLNAAAAGDLITLSTSFATAMALTSAGILIGTGTTVPVNFVCGPGIIRVNTGGSDGGTGRIQWAMRYRPLGPQTLVY